MAGNTAQPEPIGRLGWWENTVTDHAEVRAAMQSALTRTCDVDEDTGTTMLTEHVTAANLARAVAAHLRFTMTPDHPVFAAKRANMYLTVTRQPVTTEFIDEILGYVAEDEAVTVAATSASPEVAEYLAKKCRGSRVIVIPDGLFLTTLSDKA